jgi:hypothetical protein
MPRSEHIPAERMFTSGDGTTLCLRSFLWFTIGNSGRYSRRRITVDGKRRYIGITYQCRGEDDKACQPYHRHGRVAYSLWLTRLGVAVTFSSAPGDLFHHLTSPTHNSTASGAATQSIIGCSHGMLIGSRAPRESSTKTRSLRSYVLLRIVGSILITR